MQNSSVLSRLIQLTMCCVHLLCTSLSALVVSAVWCKGFGICGQGQQTALSLLTLWHVIPLKLMISVWDCGTFRFFALVSTAEKKKCCDLCVNIKRAMCPVSKLFVCALLNMTWCLVVLSVLIHGSSCMHSCDVSLCVGSRGAWSEVHVGQYGSAVVMTIILLITVLHKKRWLGVREGLALLFSTVLSFALHGRAVVTVGLNCCDHQTYFFL